MGTGLGKSRFCRLKTPHLTIEQTTANAEEPKCQSPPLGRHTSRTKPGFNHCNCAKNSIKKALVLVNF